MVNDGYIKQVKETKLLGITIDNELTWKQHINKICIKMGGVLASIKRCASFLNQHALKLITQALLLSNLDYCPTVWSNANVELIGKLQKIQNGAARTVLKRNYRANVKQMHKELNWLFVKDRLMTFIRNVSETKTPFVLYKHLEFSNKKHVYSTRHAMRKNFTKS